MSDEQFFDSFGMKLHAPYWRETHPIDRFYSKIKVSDGCWEWLGAKTDEGYGTFNVGRGEESCKLFAHRFMLTLVNGKVYNMDVHHKCKNKGCVNPAHLVDISRREHWAAHHQDCAQ